MAHLKVPKVIHNLKRAPPKPKYTFAPAKATIRPRLRHYAPTHVPMTQSQRKEKLEEGKKRCEHIKDDMKLLYSDLEIRCQALADKYDKRPRYFRDLFFQGGVRLMKSQEKTNNFNAWKCVKSHELRESGITGLNTIEISKRFITEYHALKRSKRKMREMLRKYQMLASGLRDKFFKAPTARRRAQDMAHTAASVVKMLDALKRRAGVEGFFLLVRSHPNGFTEPKWYWSNPKLEPYMKIACKGGWDSDRVSTRVEAFAVAGCNVDGTVKKSSAKVQALKNDIREKAKEKLSAELGGQEISQIPWENFASQITLEHRIVPKNWPGKFQNPSRMSSSPTALRALLKGLEDGSIGFMQLDPDEFEVWKKKYDEDLLKKQTEKAGNKGDGKKQAPKKAPAQTKNGGKGRKTSRKQTPLFLDDDGSSSSSSSSPSDDDDDDISNKSEKVPMNRRKSIKQPEKPRPLPKKIPRKVVGSPVRDASSKDDRPAQGPASPRTPTPPVHADPTTTHNNATPNRSTTPHSDRQTPLHSPALPNDFGPSTPSGENAVLGKRKRTKKVLDSLGATDHPNTRDPNTIRRRGGKRDGADDNDGVDKAGKRRRRADGGNNKATSI
ncbi:hypothetical protein Moror_6669 [Moniliophthora roreri MCA 2997]|uniref:Uncharacterized protein n=1 Tax=Moniliophthora roreri (strain MCA 2997) TaxID=1381753 RepID=V2XSR9_MONRO|nr:hypothetical protein Moror_6669 [Moniliophthora roreri MCA 2997]